MKTELSPQKHNFEQNVTIGKHKTTCVLTRRSTSGEYDVYHVLYPSEADE